MSTLVLYCWCQSDSASVLLYFTLQLEPPKTIEKKFGYKKYISILHEKQSSPTILIQESLQIYQCICRYISVSVYADISVSKSKGCKKIVYIIFVS